MSNFAKQFIAARRVSTPLVAVRTPDPASTIRSVINTLKKATEKEPDVPVIHYDICHGIVGLNTKGKAEVERVLDGGEAAMVSSRPSDTLILAEKMTEDCVLFFANGQNYWKDETVKQGVWNLRDRFKAQGSMLIILTTLGASLPAELSQDVLVLDEPLPTAEDLKAIITETYKAADMKLADDDTNARTIDALVGLPAFPAEQTLAMSLTSKGLDVDDVWERKRKVIEQVRGLTVWRGGETFADLGGLENAKTYFSRLFNGPEKPDGLVFTDELEKCFAGFGTDLSGVTTKDVGEVLSFMEDNQVTGSIFLGPPGSGKSFLAKALGNEFGVPTVQANFGAMQTSLVGQSSENVRNALAIIKAMFKRSLWIGTCNSWGSLPPELRRRYRLATFFFDILSEQEKPLVWKVYLAKYNLAEAKIPNDRGWTGAEIRNCCDTAYRLGCSLEDAACYIVPVSISAADQIRKLRTEATGKFVSASKLGLYQFQDEPEVPAKTRKMRPLDVDSFSSKVGES